MKQVIANNFNKKTLFLLLMTYKTVLELVYTFTISPTYSYYGLSLDVNWTKFIISTFLLWLIVKSSPKLNGYPSSYLFLIIEVIMLIPTLSYYWLNNKSTHYIFWLVISALIITIILRLERGKLNMKVKTAEVSLQLIFVFYILSAIYLIVERGGIDYRAFNFQTIYALRAENNISGIAGYLVNWCAKVLFPFFFIYFNYYNKKLPLILIISLQLLLYLSFGNKAFLLSIGLVIFVYIVMIRNKNTVRNFVLILTGTNLLAYLLDVFNISGVLRDIVPYRLLFIPAYGQFQYFEFFNIYEKLHFSEGTLGRLLSINYPYSEQIGVVVNRYFKGDDFYSNGNTGIFSYGFADFGEMGMVLVALILGFLFWFIDSSTRRLPVYITVCALSYVTIVLNDTGIFISLWTGGLILSILLLFIFNSSISNHHKNTSS